MLLFDLEREREKWRKKTNSTLLYPSIFFVFLQVPYATLFFVIFLFNAYKKYGAW